MVGAMALSVVVLVFLGLWGWLIVTSRRRWVKAVGGLAWLGVLAACVSFMGFLAINRLDCFPGHEDVEGWRVFEMGTDDVCEQRSLFDVLF